VIFRALTSAAPADHPAVIITVSIPLFREAATMLILTSFLSGWEQRSHFNNISQ
jgi:hypothetical protein